MKASCTYPVFLMQIFIYNSNLMPDQSKSLIKDNLYITTNHNKTQVNKKA